MTVVAGPLIAHGRSADVYELGADRAAKIFHPDWPDEVVDREIHDASLAFDLGLTPVRCYGRVDLPGCRAVAFDRIEGIALTTVAERNILRMREVAGRLAAEHVRIHRARTDRYPDIRQMAVGMLETPPLAWLTAGERSALAASFRALQGGWSPLHLDFHPFNVFEHRGAEAVIDWQSTAVGDPAADVAMTRLLFTEAELFPGASLAQRIVFSSARRAMGAMYLQRYRALTGMPLAAIDRWATAVRVIRMASLDIASERTRLRTRIQRAVAAR